MFTGNLSQLKTNFLFILIFQCIFFLLKIFSVKPAVFDLFLTFAIIGYLVSVYFAIILFPDLYSAICKLCNKNKTKVN